MLIDWSKLHSTPTVLNDTDTDDVNTKSVFVLVVAYILVNLLIELFDALNYVGICSSVERLRLLTAANVDVGVAKLNDINGGGGVVNILVDLNFKSFTNISGFEAAMTVCFGVSTICIALTTPFICNKILKIIQLNKQIVIK